MPELQDSGGFENVGGFKWIRQHWQELPKDVWVAVTSQGIIEEADNCMQLRAQLLNRSVTAEPAVIVLRHDGKELIDTERNRIGT